MPASTPAGQPAADTGPRGPGEYEGASSVSESARIKRREAVDSTHIQPRHGMTGHSVEITPDITGDCMTE